MQTKIFIPQSNKNNTNTTLELIQNILLRSYLLILRNMNFQKMRLHHKHLIRTENRHRIGLELKTDIASLKRNNS